MRKRQLLKKRMLALVLSVTMAFASPDTYVVLAAESSQTDETEAVTAVFAEDSDSAGNPDISDGVDSTSQSNKEDESNTADDYDATVETDLTDDSNAAEDSDSLAEENETDEQIDDSELTEDETEESDVDAAYEDESEMLGEEAEPGNDGETAQSSEEQTKTDSNENILDGGKVNDITWTIDKSGLLTITGRGDYISDGVDTPPWASRGDVLSAVVNLYDITSTRNMFYNCSNLESVDLTNLDTSSVVDMRAMFSVCHNLNDLDVSNFQTSNVMNMRGMFENCYSLNDLDLSNFDTGNVTDMSYMFSFCYGLSSLDVSSFDTDNVTNMIDMFCYCSSLSSLDVSNFDTSNVTNMAEMFADCRGLNSLDVSSFDTSNVTNMTGMFGGCRGLSSLDISRFDTSNVINMSNMFLSCTNLKSLDVSRFDTSNVTNMRYMFYNCVNLSNLDLSKFNMGNVTNMSYMFYNCYCLNNLNMGKFDTDKVSDMSYMFKDCYSLRELDLSSFDLINATNLTGIFDGCDRLSYMITPKNCPESITVKLPVNEDTNRWHDDNDTTYETLPTGLDYSIILHKTDYSGDGTFGEIIDSGSINNITWSIDEAGLLTITGTGDYISDGIDSPPWAGSGNGHNSLIVRTAVVNVTGITSTRNMFSGCEYLTSVDLAKLNTSEVRDMSKMFEDCYRLNSLDVSRFDTKNVTNMSGMFSGCSGLSSLDVSSFDTSNATNMSGMFSGCSGLSSLDVSSFDTSNVTDMSKMFFSCFDLNNLDVSSFDTSNVTDMNAMFMGCQVLNNLDVSSFDTSNVTDMGSMFSTSGSLSSLDLSSFDTSNVTNMTGMFESCNSLNSLDLSNFDTSNVTSMMLMFSYCKNLNSLDLSNFDTSNIESLWGMFWHCENLVSLDLSSFDTSRVFDMYYTFANCSSLSSLDLSSFDTSRVTDMRNMFSDCSSLNSLDLSNFDMYSVRNMAGMFSRCDSLAYIRTPKNCYKSVTLPVSDSEDIWYQDIDTVCTELPTGLDYSVELYKNGYPGDGKTKRVVFISGVSIKSKGYDAEPITYTGTAVVKDLSGEIIPNVSIIRSYTGKLADGRVYKETMGAPSQAGTYTLSLTIADDIYTGRTIYSFSIMPKAVTITAPSASIKTGEHLPVLSEFACTVDGLLETDALITEPSLKYSVKNISTATAGSYHIIPYGADAGNNYNIKYVNGKLTVEGTEDDTEKQTVTISGITIENKVYDGKPNTYTGAAVVKDSSGIVISDISLSYSYTGTLADSSAYAETAEAPTQAGSYTLSVAVTENDTYTGQSSYDFAIDKKEITVTAPSASIKTGEQLPELSKLTCTVDGLVETDKLTTEPSLKYSAENISTTTIGSYDIIPYGADAGNNYSIKYVNGKLTISESGDNPPYGDENGDNPYYVDAGDDTDYDSADRTDLNDIGGAIAAIKAKTYDGARYEPTLKVTIKNEKGKKVTLTEGTDYRVLYSDNLNAGTGTVTVKGNGIYKGNLTATFTIKPKSIKKLKVVAGSMSVIEEGTAESELPEVPICVYDGAAHIKLDEGYTLSHTSAQVAADVSKGFKVTITGTGNYTGTATAKIPVYSGDAQVINPDNVTLAENDQKAAYTGKAIKDIKPIVKIGETPLTEKKDYKLSYKNNKDVGTAFIIVTGKGTYKGTVVVPFEITANEGILSLAKTITDKTYNGKLQKPAVTVKSGAKKLKKNKDYTIYYKNNLHAGTATVVVTGIGNYAGQNGTWTFKITPQKISKASVKGTQADGLTVTYAKRQLKLGSDYTLQYGETKGKKIKVTINAVEGEDRDFKDSVTKSVKIQ